MPAHRQAAIIRHVLEASGLDRLIPIYPTTETAAAAGLPAAVIPLAARPSPAHPDTQVSSRPGGAAADQRPAGQLPHDIAGKRITDALQRLDDTISEIRDHASGDIGHADTTL